MTKNDFPFIFATATTFVHRYIASATQLVQKRPFFSFRRVTHHQNSMDIYSARVTTASMTEHAVACLVEEHAVWTKRGLEQGKGEVNRIEKGVFVNMFACIAGSVSHYKGCPFCVVYRLIFTFTGKIYFQHAARADFSRSYLYRCSSPLKHT